MLAGSVVGVSGWGNIDVGSDGRTLQVVRAGTHNPDDYTCTATNQAGVIDIPVTLNDLAASLYTRYLNIHCVTIPLQQHLDQVWPRTAEMPPVCTHSFQANIARLGLLGESSGWMLLLSNSELGV
ncbi:hypothetical protein Pcinc_035507 [Petrolisthes cinctipes]|uniref:Ig-like domain-containing protein n=1 Tax=Petrolisthes cinctipes TaxID=88211 RepID=A0AAE1EN87_PETCI|nr:hypothetical protein Pcinc_035507 [Petrolisthes cinctipes]